MVDSSSHEVKRMHDPFQITSAVLALLLAIAHR